MGTLMRLRNKMIGANMLKNDTSQFLTRRQTAELFQVSITTIWRLERSGKLVPVRLGLARSPRYRREDVDRLAQPTA